MSARGWARAQAALKGEEAPGNGYEAPGELDPSRSVKCHCAGGEGGRKCANAFEKHGQAADFISQPSTSLCCSANRK